MSLQSIQTQIKNAFEHERRTGAFKRGAFQFISMHGKPMTEASYAQLWSTVEEIFRALPAFIEQVGQAAAQAGFAAAAQLLIQRLEEYWHLENDFLPDSLGLIGILDDAYCSVCCLDNLSAKVSAQTGQRLISDDLSEIRSLLRTLIAESIASQLDALIARDMQKPDLNETLSALVAMVVQGRPLPQFPSSPVRDEVKRRMALVTPTPRWVR